MTNELPEKPKDELDTSIDWKRFAGWLILPALITILGVVLTLMFPNGF